MARVFISHSSRDAASAAWIASWLRGCGFEAPFLDFDKHSGIPPGSNWEHILYQAIATSQALLIVQSENWNASKWCFAEFTQARALGKPVFQLLGTPPALSNSVDLPPITSDLQQLDLRRDPEGSLASLAAALRELALDDRGGFAWDPHRSPYPGLLAFDQEDAAIYFGREEEVRALIERLQMLRIQGSGRLLVVLGASGAGKSSLLRAGVLPRLARSGHQWIPLPPLRPQTAPCEAFARVLAIALGEGRGEEEIMALLQRADSPESLRFALQSLASELRVARQAPEAQILITVDQGEELFTQADPQEARRFFALLGAALREETNFQGVITLRSDFLNELQAAEALTTPLVGMPLPLLPKERLVDIIKGPARVAGFVVEEAFVQAAILDASTNDALPLLAFALRQIYDRFGSDSVLSLQDYQSLGDAHHSPLENAVRLAADEVLAVEKPTEIEMTALREAFVTAMVRVNEHGDYTRKPARWDALPAKALPILQRLVQARLLTVEQRGGHRWVEVAHEAMLRKWPLLRGWLDEAREVIVGTQQLEPDLREWEKAEGPQKEATLLQGLKLSRAQGWLQNHPNQFSPPLRAYVEASLSHDQKLRRRSQRKLVSVLAGLGTLTLVAVVAWGWGEWKARAAYQADTRQFISAHLMLLEKDPPQSLVYGLAAMHRLQGFPNESLPLSLSLEKAANNNFLTGAFLSRQKEVWSLAETPDGRILSGGKEGTVRLLNADGSPQGPAIQTPHGAGVRGLVALAGGRWWSAGDEGTLQLWSGSTRVGRPIVTGHGSIQVMVRDRNGDLITGGTDGLLRRWEAQSGRPLGAPLASGHQEVWSLTVLPNGDWVSGGREGTLRWWRQGRPTGLSTGSGQGAVSSLLALSNDSILSGGDDGTVKQWDSNLRLREEIDSGHSSLQAMLRRRNNTVISGGSEFMIEHQNNYIRTWNPRDRSTLIDIRLPAGHYFSIVELCNGDLLSGSSKGMLQHWRGGHPLGPPLPTGHGAIYALSVNGHGDVLSGGADGMIRVWQNGRLSRSFATGQGAVTSLLLLPDGTVLSGGRDGTLKQWSLDGRASRAPVLQTHQGTVWTIAQLRNGDLLTGGDDGNLRRWRAGRQVALLDTPHNTVVSLVVRSNGDWITGGSGGALQVWRNSKPLGSPFLTGLGNLWMLTDRRDGSLVSTNGNGTVKFYPTPRQAILRACKKLKPIFFLASTPDEASAEARQLCAQTPSQPAERGG